MKPGDKFTFLAIESDNKFGLECEVVSVNGDKMTIKVVGKNWKSTIIPIAWAKPKKKYSPEEISAIRKGQRRRRFAGKF